MSRALRIFLATAFCLLLAGQSGRPAACDGVICPQPPVTGVQPKPAEIAGAFNDAGNNRLGERGPTLPKIYQGTGNQLRKVDPFVPCILLKAMAFTESRWFQFDTGYVYGKSGPTLISRDCGYGIMQITTGMDGSKIFPDASFDPRRVAAEPVYNIGTGALFLIEKWNGLPYYVGENDPAYAEDWYYAVWAYNGFVNKNNPDYNCPVGEPTCSYANNPFRPPFDGSQTRDWYPYQELVWGYAAHPPSYDGRPLWAPVALSQPPRGSIGVPPARHIPRPEPAHAGCDALDLPGALTFLYSIPDGKLAPGSITLQPRTSPAPTALQWAVSTNAAWLAVTPASGSSPATFTLTPQGFDTAAPGVLEAPLSVTVTSPLGVAGSPATISVRLRVVDTSLTQVYLPQIAR